MECMWFRRARLSFDRACRNIAGVVDSFPAGTSSLPNIAGYMPELLGDRLPKVMHILSQDLAKSLSRAVLCRNPAWHMTGRQNRRACCSSQCVGSVDRLKMDICWF